jgi:hypothetical protein
MAQQKYISLKEAAQLSGYTPDYVGQLIRRGKLPGKQVFSNISWVTTEEALQNYIHNNGKTIPTSQLQSWKERIVAEFDFAVVYKIILGALIMLMVVFLLFLVYIFSVSVDHQIDHGYQQKLQES